MKVKTSITLSADVLETVDALCGRGGHRSELIETALRAYIARRRQEERDAREIEIINLHADRWNQEMADILLDQADL